MTTTNADILPVIPARMEMVSDNVNPGSVHGWHTCKMFSFRGTLYAFAMAPRPEVVPQAGNPDTPEIWAHDKAMIFRRPPGGKWEHIATLPPRVYSMCVGPDGTVWFGSAAWYDKTEVFRTRRPLDFDNIEQVYTGTCAYLAASVDAEGNFILLHAESSQMEINTPNAIIAVFFDRQTGKWHKSRLVTPEGRYGYESIVLRGRRALAVIQSALKDRKGNPVPPHYTWRHVRLVGCDDLTKGEWTSRPWLMPAYGNTALLDMMVAPDGGTYLSYTHVAGESFESVKNKPDAHCIARISDDLTTELFTPGPSLVKPSLLFVDSKGGWYALGRPKAGEALHLWRLDRLNSFRPGQEFVLSGTEKLEGYVNFTLRPERFGGDANGDRVRLLSVGALTGPDGKPALRAELWHGEFDLPVQA